MTRRNPLTESEQARVTGLMREIDALAKRGQMFAAMEGKPEGDVRRVARDYNDRIAVLRVLVGNRIVDRLENTKWLYGPTGWTIIVGQEWDAVLKHQSVRIASCNPATCRNPRHHHAARRNADFSTSEAAVLHARKSEDPDTYAYYLGYATGLSTAKRGMPINRKLHEAKDPYARGYSAGFAHGMQMKSGARKNLDVGMAVLSGATAAVVGKIIRPNPHSRQNSPLSGSRCVMCGGFLAFVTTQGSLNLYRCKSCKARYSDVSQRTRQYVKSAYRNPICGRCGRSVGSWQEYKHHKMICRGRPTRQNPITRTVSGRIAKFCGASCAEGFKEDRIHGLIYPSIKDESGNLISIEKASMKYGFCAYCMTDFESGERAISPNPRKNPLNRKEHAQFLRIGRKIIDSYRKVSTPEAKAHWAGAWRSLQTIHASLSKGTGLQKKIHERVKSLGRRVNLRETPYYMPNASNPLAGRWSGWDMLPDRSGFVKRLSSTEKIRVYLWKAGPRGKPWTWSVEKRGYVIARGASATDEIAKKSVLAVIRRGVILNNPSSKIPRSNSFYIGGQRISKKIPTWLIRNWVGKFHVSTEYSEIEDALRAQIAKSKDPGWTPAAIRQAICYAIKVHNVNREIFYRTMKGQF
jgi:hypothetical protein